LRFFELLLHIELNLGHELALGVEDEESTGILCNYVIFVNKRAEVVIVDPKLRQQIHEGKISQGLHHN